MAELRSRAELEARLARALGKTQQEEFRRLMEALGDPPDLNNLPADFWDTHSGALQAAAQPVLEAVFMAQAEQLLSASLTGFDIAAVNARAAQWARQYSYELVRGITDTTREIVRQSIEGFFTDQRTIGDLKESLSRAFGPVRAEMIAITETTRAAVEGEHAFQDELRKLGLKPEGIVETANDDRTCAICGPKHKQPVSAVGSPPFHPGCRCWENTRIAA